MLLDSEVLPSVDMNLGLNLMASVLRFHERLDVSAVLIMDDVAPNSVDHSDLLNF
jgi:hypothetical protein